MKKILLMGVFAAVFLTGYVFVDYPFGKPKMDISMAEILIKFLLLSDSRDCVTLNELIGESLYSTCSVSSDNWYSTIKLTYDPKHPRQPLYIFMIVVGKNGNEYLNVFDDMMDFIGNTSNADVNIQSGDKWKRLDLNNYNTIK